MANIWCKLWDIFFVSFKEKTLKGFSFTQKMLWFSFNIVYVCVLTMLLTLIKNNKQLKIQIYNHSLVPIPMWCEERWVLMPMSSPFPLPSWPLTSSHKHPTPNHHSLIKSFIHRPSSTRPYLSSGYCSSLQCLPLIAFVDLWPLPPFPLLFRQYSTPEAKTNLILKLRLSSFRIRWAEKVGWLLLIIIWFFPTLVLMIHVFTTKMADKKTLIYIVFWIK